MGVDLQIMRFDARRKQIATELMLRVLLLVIVLFSVSRIVAPVSIEIPSGSIEVSLRPGFPGGRLTVPLGPLGQISWRVTRAPIDVQANVSIDPAATSLPDADDLRLGRLRGKLLWSKVPWVLLFGIAAALLLTRAIGIRRTRAAVGGAGFALGAVAILTAVAVLTFNANAFNDPRYRGPVRDVPRILTLVKEIRRDFPGTRANIARAVEGLARLRRELLSGGPPPNDEPTRKLLVIGDLQSNPVGLIIAERLAVQFEVDGILNTGDVTERGTQLEGELFARFGTLGLPHVIAPGNHEDSDALGRMAQVPGVKILEGAAAVITLDGGAVIVGGEDPNARSIEADPGNDLAKVGIPVGCEAIARKASIEKMPIVLVHDRRLGECASDAAIAAGRPLLFIWGHSEKAAFAKHGSVVHLSPGTSGGGGIKTPNDKPYGFALLELDEATNQPVSVCLFAFEKPEELGDAACHVLDRGVAIPE